MLKPELRIQLSCLVLFWADNNIKNTNIALGCIWTFDISSTQSFSDFSQWRLQKKYTTDRQSSSLWYQQENTHRRGSITVSVTRKKSPNVYKTCPKMISLEKWKISTSLQNLPKNVDDLCKLILPKALKRCPKSNKSLDLVTLITVQLSNASTQPTSSRIRPNM